MFRRIISAMAFAGFATAAPAADLLMVEQTGCAYCVLWHKQIGPIYPKTAAGATAPLAQIQLTDLKDDGPAIKRPVVFTPTFLLVENGAEIARLEGYAGEDFFWPLVEKMISDHTPLAAKPVAVN